MITVWSAMRVMELPTTLVRAITFAPKVLAYFTAIIVSVVSPDCVIATTQSSPDNALYTVSGKSLASSKFGRTPASEANMCLPAMPAYPEVPIARK